MNVHIDAAVISVDAPVVHQWLNDDKAVLVDVRETSEFDQEHIPGALLLPMSVFDPELFPKVPGKNIVLHCAIGKRSEAAGKMLLKQGHKNVIHMSGGLGAWKEAGFETEEQFLPPTIEKPSASKNQLAGDSLTAPDRSGVVLPGVVLVDEFMTPHELTITELADAIGVTTEVINSLISGDEPVTAELSLRLARYFCTDNDFWLNLQLTSDLDLANHAIGQSVFNTIKPRLCA